MRDPITVCEKSDHVDSSLFITMSIVFLIYLTIDIVLAAIAILRVQPTMSKMSNRGI
jgi:hypothetical protein